MKTKEEDVIRGRDSETLVIERLLESTAAGAGSFIVVSGGAGAGKSLLLSLAARKARAQEFTVLQARASFAERNLAFGLARRLVESSESALARGGIGAMASIPDTSTEIEDDRSEKELCSGLGRLRQLFESIASTNIPLLLVVDNIHWADAPSMQWLSTLSERMDHLPVAAIVSACDGLPGTDPALLDDILFSSSDQIRLSGLGYAATSQVFEDRLGEVADQAFVATCLQVTEGNPLLLATVADEMFRCGMRPSAETARILPSLVIDGLAMSTQVRLRRVSPNALAMFQTVAVLDGQATIERVAELTATAPAAVVDDCRAITRMGVLATTPRGLRVAQPLLRNAILRESAFRSLQEVHAQAAMMLHADEVDPAIVAAHLLVSPVAGQMWAVETLRAAARSCMSAGDPSAAVLYLQRALQEPVSENLQASIHLDIVIAGCRTDISIAARSITQAAALLAPDDLRARVGPEVTTLLALSDREEVASLLGTNDLDTRGLNEHDLRWVLFGQSVCSVDELKGRIKQLHESASTSSLVLGLGAMVEVLHNGSRSSAMTQAARACSLTPRTAEDLGGWMLAIWVYTFSGDLTRAASICNEVMIIAGQWQDQPSLALALTSRAMLRNQAGSPRSALEDARSAFELFQQIGISRHSSLARLSLLVMLDSLCDLGENWEAIALLESKGLAGNVSAGYQSMDILLHRGRLRMACGYMSEAIEDLESCGQLATDFGISNPVVAPWRSLLAEAYAREGWFNEARRYAEEDVTLIRSWGARTYLGSALRVQALAAPRKEKPTLLMQSVGQLRDSGASVLLAQSLADYGEVLAETTDGLHEARQVLRESVELAEQAETFALAERALEVLSFAGGRMRRKKRSGIDGLTRSERKVAELAVAGHTNREIAKMLFVQRRTVEVHLTNAYRKLDVEGRDQLARFFGVAAPGGRGAGSS